MKKLLVYLKNYKKESFCAPLFKLLEASFELVVPLVVASIVDVGIKNNDIKYILIRAGILLLLAIVGMVMAITAQYFAAKAATGFGRELRSSLFEKIESLSFSELDTIGTSSLITRMTNDVNQVQNGVNLILRLFLRSPFIVIGATVMALFINVKIALIFVIAIILLSFVIFGIMLLTIPRYKNIQSNLDNVTLKTRENLIGARVIRAFSMEDEEKESFKNQNDFLSHLQRSTGRISGLLNPATYIIINFAVIALVYSGSLKVDSGILSQGQVIALYNYMSQILVELIKLANLIITVTKSFASAARIESVFEENSTLRFTNDNEKVNDYAVLFDNVSLRYKNAKENSLDNISFFANKGEVIGIIGATGSGKSSLISLIGHHYDAYSGNVYVDGINVNAYEQKTLNDKIGFAFQKAVLFAGTIADNIKMGNKNANDAEIKEALKAAQVLDVVEEKGGLKSNVADGGTNFSGGQKQRINVARALVKKPQILILDDSASALDFATEAKLRSAILSLPYKPTVFIVSQRASSVMSADKIIVMEDGEIVDMGTHDYLMDHCPLYLEIYSSQFAGEDEYEK